MRSIACAWVISLAATGIALSASGGTSQSGAPHAISGPIEGRISAYGARYHGRWRIYDYLDPWGLDGLEYDLFLAAAPLNFSALRWDAVPYYFADENYYAWHAGAQAYELEHAAPEGARLPADNRYECRRWATDQTGCDPIQSTNDSPTPSAPAGTAGMITAEAPTIKR
jgi:hypothetical protein